MLIRFSVRYIYSYSDCFRILYFPIQLRSYSEQTKDTQNAHVKLHRESINTINIDF